MLLKTSAFIVVVGLALSAQSQPAEDAFYQAIREDDLAKLRALVRDHGPDVEDAQRQTPLMLAAAFGSRDAVRLLLAAGANPRAVSTGGVTALHWGVTDPVMTRMLLEAGADVHAVSQLGRTPLMVAASGQGTAEAVRLLLAKGAKVDAPDAIGITPLIAAAVVNDAEVVKLLLAQGADVNARSNTLQALMGAATNGNLQLVRLLLDRGANVNAVSPDAGAKVKNGPVQFGRVTALHLAVLSGNAAVLRQLLAAGARVDATEIRGMTPLMLAIATDRPEPVIVRALLEAGANPTLRSLAGESAIDWAEKFRHPAVLAELKIDGAATAARTMPPVAAMAAHNHTPRAAVERSLPVLRTASGRMLTDGGCVACHAQPLTGVAVNLAYARGWSAERAATETSQALTTVASLTPPMLQLREGGGLPDGLVYVAFLLANDGRPPSRATDALVRYLAAKQRADGSWEGVGGTRAPMQDGNLSRTALSIRALRVYATPARRAGYAANVRRAAGWLSRQAPLSTEDRIMQLLGLHWAKTDERVRRSRTRELLALQRADGGWAQTPYLESDAYATGQVLYTLRELGMPAGDAALQRGVAFLLRTEADDGTWHVTNRAMKVQPYFDSGFPYQHDQWISHAGTAWAVMGLTTATADAAAVTAANR